MIQPASPFESHHSCIIPGSNAGQKKAPIKHQDLRRADNCDQSDGRTCECVGFDAHRYKGRQLQPVTRKLRTLRLRGQPSRTRPGASARGLPAARASRAWRHGGRGGRNRDGIPPNTLSIHFDRLRHAGLVSFERQGRSLIYSARYDTMHTPIEYLTENCANLSCANQ